MLQLSFGMEKINAKCFQSYKQVKKKDKNFGENKPANILLTDIFSKKQQSSTNRPIKKIRTTKKIFGAMIDKARVKAKSFL